MKTKILSSLIIIGIASTYVFIRFNIIWTGERIDLKELGTIKLGDGVYEHDIFNDQDWLILTSEDQRLNWKDSGYNLPVVNFKETFIVLSNHKIKRLYKENGCDKCTGVPNGFALYDFFNSEKGTYYIYAIPAIWLSQGVG